ncbi:MAG: hypothetical protein KGL10_06755 [Alphaproteobacteria bacterium]|nr:hypothetical protein [Alphaproteobacteria bacterium]MDE2336993.1 hypothetical protein [Alphaproteobacteria bacterium]
MTWALFALLAGVTNCVQMEFNSHYKHDGLELNAWRSLVSTGLMLPLLPFMEWPSDPRYYLAVLLGAAINVAGMMMQYNLAAEKNGRVATLYQPVTIFLTFCLWLAIDKSQLDFLRAHPLNLAVLLFSFALLCASLLSVRKNAAGWRALTAIFPVGVLYAFLGVITKLVLDTGAGVLAISLGFVLLSNFMMTLISFPAVLGRRRRGKKLFDRKILKPASLVSVFHTVSWVLINVATVLAPNAAYPFAVTALGPLWFMVYYRARGIKDDASPLAGAGMFAAAVLLVLFSKS